jgi:UDP-apiose/xylose synthase
MSSNNSVRLAIFGAGGFVGSHLVKCLIANGYEEIYCYDLYDEKLHKIVPSGGYQFQTLDIRSDDALMQEAIREADIVIDLVAYAQPSIYMDRPIEVVELNLFDNLKIVDECIKQKKFLVQFSTCEVYGKSGGKTEPFKEDTTDLIVGPVTNHRWIYSCAKQLLERMVHAYGLRGDLEYIIIRPFNFIGPEMDYLIQSKDEGTPRVFPGFMSALLYEHTLEVVDGGQNSRTFTYIDDAVEAIVIAINNRDQLTNQIVNVGNPHNMITILDLAYLMRSLYAKLTGIEPKSEVSVVSSIDFYGEGYEDCDWRIPNIDKLANLGWEPRFGLEETLISGMEYYINTVQPT